MTVCIGAICEREDEPYVVVVADRLTTRQGGVPIEAEHTRSKIEEYTEVPNISAATLGAADMDYFDDFNQKLRRKLGTRLEDDEEVPLGDFVDIAKEAYSETINDRINSQVLSTWGLTVEELPAADIQESARNKLMSKVEEHRRRIVQNLVVLLAGIADGDPFIYKIVNGDAHPKNNASYAAIGSGKESAFWVLGQSEYDAKCSRESCILTVYEARKQAENLSGVGDEKTDIGVITSTDGLTQIPSEIIDSLEGHYGEYIDDLDNRRGRYLEDGEGLLQDELDGCS